MKEQQCGSQQCGLILLQVYPKLNVVVTVSVYVGCTQFTMILGFEIGTLLRTTSPLHFFLLSCTLVNVVTIWSAGQHLLTGNTTLNNTVGRQVVLMQVKPFAVLKKPLSCLSGKVAAKASDPALLHYAIVRRPMVGSGSGYLAIHQCKGRNRLHHPQPAVA